jgi:hypothetical protein
MLRAMAEWIYFIRSVARLDSGWRSYWMLDRYGAAAADRRAAANYLSPLDYSAGARAPQRP